MSKKSSKRKRLSQNEPSRQVPLKGHWGAGAEGLGSGGAGGLGSGGARGQGSGGAGGQRSRGARARIALIAAGVLLLAAGGWYYRTKLATPDLDFRGYNVLFVTIDTLRADHVGAYGYDNIRTNNLDKLASQGYLFRRAISQVPLTLPSHTSIFTGTFPIYHGVRDNGGYFVRPQSLTLAEILKQSGYKTAAFVSAFILDSKWGLDQGFDTYFDDFDITKADETGMGEVQRPGGETNRKALEWLEKTDSPFFCWIHYYDPHDPYEPPEPFRTEYRDRPYDGEIAYTDTLLGQVLDLLDTRKLTDKTIVIVTGDHGEGLGEHHELTHAMFIYDSTLHVPLILKLPRRSSGDIAQTVQLVDIMPTLLDLLTIEKPSVLQGRSLIPLLKHQTLPETTAFSESQYAEIHYGWSPLYGITTDKFKFIQAPKAELFNLKEDPRESNNLNNSLVSIAKASGDRITELRRKHSPSEAQQQNAAQVDLESQEALKALGYIGGGPSEKMKESGKSIDPKDKIDLVESLHAAFRDMRSNGMDAAQMKVTAIIGKDPEIVDAYLLLGMIASKQEKYPEAVRAFQQTLSLRPDNIIAIYNLAQVYRKSDDTDKAIDGFKEVLRRDPHYVNAMVNLGQIYSERSQPDIARPYYENAMERYHQMLNSSSTVEAIVSIHDSLSGLYFGQGKIDEAEKEIREILRLNPKHPEAHYNLAQVYEKKGELRKAAEEYQNEIEYNPTNFKAYNDLALLLRETGNFRDAVPLLQEAVRLQPENFGACYLLADSLAQSGGDLQDARKLAEKAVSLNPQFHRGYTLLADIYSKLGMSREAAAAAQAAGP